MSDITERLRTRPTGDPYLHMMVHEAADTIDALRAERDALKAAAAVCARKRGETNLGVDGVIACDGLERAIRQLITKEQP